MKITEPKDRRWDNDNYYLCVEEMNKAIGKFFHHERLLTLKMLEIP